ncbi:MAG: DUF4834 family protein [Tenuifilaceae bacterium]|uniref:DUF4834 family protein n=1 Tax=Perlabentimonas gracilis TaxID=2715279 RepID=UPI00140A722B|nr:DUF4834 family protein [Perlabentimonas gracilis]MDX9769928.1 DUF4834 family protein [Tenuifilaceae bacterium]NHB68990.1 DUF4834 family protein [Perlabentimonas gracilis]
MLILLRFFAIVFLIFFLITLISRWALRRFFRKMQNASNSTSYQQNRRPEGDVYVSKTAQQDKIVDKDVGDYVDYEEVD